MLAVSGTIAGIVIFRAILSGFSVASTIQAVLIGVGATFVLTALLMLLNSDED